MTKITDNRLRQVTRDSAEKELWLWILALCVGLFIVGLIAYGVFFVK